MSWKDTRAAIWADLHRYGGASGCVALWRTMRREPGLRLTVYKRLAVHFRRAFPPAYPLFRALFASVSRRYCLNIPINLKMGIGIYISHCHGITINGACELGDNLNISQNVTLGQANRGRHKGVPRLGSRIYIGPGATVAGGVAVGDDVLISANSLVTRDVESGSVMIGVPAVKVSDKGSEGYVEYTVGPVGRR